MGIHICKVAFTLLAVIFFWEPYRAHSNISNDIVNTTSPNSRFWLVNEDSIEGPSATNSIFSELKIQNGDRGPSVAIFVGNKSTNVFRDCWCLYKVSYLKIELTDSKGLPIGKTMLGNEIGGVVSPQEFKSIVSNRFSMWLSGKSRTDGFRPLISNQAQQYGFSFAIVDLFEIKKTDEYTLRIQIPFIQRVDEKFKTMWLWLPEIVAKIQIRSDSVSPNNVK